MKILEVVLPRDLQQAGMLDEEACAWAYFAMRQHECEEMKVRTPSGWYRTYTLSEIRAMLQKNPEFHGVVRMGARRSQRLKAAERGKISLL